MDNDITIYGAVLAICLTWARHHRTKQGLAELERAVTRRAQSSERWYQAMFELNLAECLLNAGEIDSARSWLDSAVARDETFVRAETWRIRGELARRRGDTARATGSFQRAARIARQQGADTFEQRAVNALRSHSTG